MKPIKRGNMINTTSSYAAQVRCFLSPLSSLLLLLLSLSTLCSMKLSLAVCSRSIVCVRVCVPRRLNNKKVKRIKKKKQQ